MNMHDARLQVIANLTEIFGKHAADKSDDALSLQNSELCAEAYEGLKAANKYIIFPSLDEKTGISLFEKFNDHMGKWEAKNSRFEEMMLDMPKGFKCGDEDVVYGAVTPTHIKADTIREGKVCAKIALALFR